MVRKTQPTNATAGRPSLGQTQRSALPLGRPGAGASPAALQALRLQRQAGNTAVARLLTARRPAQRSQPLTVSRCGPDHPDCGCSEEERAAAEPDRAPTSIQRDGPPWGNFPSLDQKDPFGRSAALDKLTFTDRFFMDLSLPTVCPNCHRERPTAPLPPVYVDKEATEDRLVAWGKESKPMLQTASTIHTLQLDPGAVDPLVEDFGSGLTMRITSSHEFTGSETARAAGAESVRRHWADIRPIVRGDLVAWFQNEQAGAIARTPSLAEPMLQPTALRRLETAPIGGTAPLGRWNATAKAGDTVGNFVIDDVGAGMIWFHLSDQPLWHYMISETNFIKRDPFVGDVVGRVYQNTEWILHITPWILKAGAFALGFSGTFAFVVLGVALDEFAEEMEADAEGRPGRSLTEILGDAGMQLLVDRVFHHLLGGSAAGKAAAATGKNAAKIERIAAEAAPMIRRELAAAEKPLVEAALEAGSARKVTDQALRSEGYAVEVAVESAGERHLYRLDAKGHWCRFSSPMCDLDLGADLAKAAKEPKSFTAAAAADARDIQVKAADEIHVLTTAYERSRKLGRVDLSVLTPEERAVFDTVVDPEDAAHLTLAELRGLPAKLELGKDAANAARAEAKLLDRLYQEGRPLYEIMRTGSPSGAATSATRREWGFLDFATTRAPRTGATQIDHVLSLNEIVHTPGFAELSPARRLEIVNDPKILRPIDSAANGSRGDWSWHEWPNASIHYDARALARMRNLEDELRGYVQQRITALRGR